MRELFEARTIAVVGASPKEGKVGNVIVKNLIASGFSGGLYPVNPKATEILGLRCYPDLASIPGEVEMIVVAVPSMVVPTVMEEAGGKGVKVAVVISAGFKEIGKEGAELEREVGRIARRWGIRVLGPNCLGVISTQNRMNATFTNVYPREGSVAITSQSGAINSVVLDWARATSIGFSKFVSVGNKLDIDEADLLTYLRDDERTSVIGMYIEGIDRGKEFMAQAREASMTKPIIALKAGRTGSGAKAASSHTGALSGSDKVYDAAMAQSGVMRVKTVEELFDLLQVFSSMPLPKGDGLAIVTNAGGLGVMAADAASDGGLTLASFAKATTDKLRASLPEEANIYNPVDVIGDADAARFEGAIRTVMDDPNVHMVVAMVAPTDLLDITAVARTIASFAGKVDIPIATALVGGQNMAEGAALLRAAGVPNYDSPDRAVWALGAMDRYREMRGRPAPSPAPAVEGDRDAVRKVLEKAKAEERTGLSEEEGKSILTAYGVPVPAEGHAASADEAVHIAGTIGYPVVLKVSSPDIAHKTDVGGVAVNLRDDEEVRRAYQLMMSRVKDRMPQARVEGALVEKMFQGREVIVGMVRDAQFGPVITFGLGGIFVEIMKDVSQRIAPLTPEGVDEMVRSIKAYPILTGARGRRPADLAALKDVIFRVAKIAEDFPEITELEINPVMVGDEGEGVGAVDALATIRREKR
ncbi:acetate--CoA ligase alpha subunit [Methanomassiliicoccus luminyensis]|uniref:acetate--CoA ligase alpha subunit n=1 Tax=Methanomassiliicoccus luminyensis TaxID=1080712 RepID=UPI0003696A0F|nr:acetate--CoA ligase [Methanomassiliicoccus luminyensis]